MNYIKPIARILDVKLGEAFRLTGYKELFRITEQGLEEKLLDITWFPVVDGTLHEIITGITEIVKLEEEQ